MSAEQLWCTRCGQLASWHVTELRYCYSLMNTRAPGFDSRSRFTTDPHPTTADHEALRALPGHAEFEAELSRTRAAISFPVVPPAQGADEPGTHKGWCASQVRGDGIHRACNCAPAVPQGAAAEPTRCPSTWQPISQVHETPTWRCELAAGHRGPHQDSTTTVSTYVWQEEPADAR